MMDIKEIMQFLPHRYPFLLLDRVLELTPGEDIKAIKNITINEPFFNGHFPGEPIMPGVLMIEAMAQAAGIIVLKDDLNLSCEKDLFVLVGVDKVRFKRMVKPGDQLIIQVKLDKAKGKIWKFMGEIYVDNQLACSAEIINART